MNCNLSRVDSPTGRRYVETVRLHSIMGIFAGTVFVVSLAAGLSSGARTPDDPPDILSRVQERYESITTLTSNFRQISKRHNVLGNLEEVRQEGKLEVKKPGMLRWDYFEPEKSLYVSNGKNLWVYKPAQNQVIVSAWDPKALALQFLLGRGNLARDFDSRRPTPQETTALQIDAKEWIALTPKPDRQNEVGPVEALFLKVDPKSALVEEVTVVDPIGATTRWIFTRIRLNPTIADSHFLFQPPKGAAIINQ